MARNRTKSTQPASDDAASKSSKAIKAGNSVAKITGKTTKSTNPLHARVKIQGDGSDPSSMA